MTNDWAASSIGKVMQMRFSGGMSEQLGRTAGSGGLSQNAGGQQHVDFLIQPQEFTMLRPGGEESDLRVDGIIFQGGRRWLIPAGDKNKVQNFIRHSFPQVYEGHSH